MERYQLYPADLSPSARWPREKQIQLARLYRQGARLKELCRIFEAHQSVITTEIAQLCSVRWLALSRRKVVYAAQDIEHMRAGVEEKGWETTAKERGISVRALRTCLGRRALIPRRKFDASSLSKDVIEAIARDYYVLQFKELSEKYGMSYSALCHIARENPQLFFGTYRKNERKIKCPSCHRLFVDVLGGKFCSSECEQFLKKEDVALYRKILDSRRQSRYLRRKIANGSYFHYNKHRLAIQVQGAYNSMRQACARHRKSGRQVEVKLTKEQLADWYTKQATCSYCGITLEQLRKLASGTSLMRQQYRWSIDRKDSTGDYSLDNIAACCFYCNVAKSDLFTFDEAKILGRSMAKIWKRRLSKC